MEDLFFSIADHISQATGNKFRPLCHRPLGGGCINRSEVMEGDGCRFFVKLNNRRAPDMFAAEAEGLRALIAASPLRVPAPVCHGICGDTAYLVLEHLDLSTVAGSAVHAALGNGLALQHRSQIDQFGWHRDNTIGSTPQPNAWRDRWVDFYREMRLGHQLRLAGGNGMDRRTLTAGDRLLHGLENFFVDYAPEASLLHGDLWCGNFAADADGLPVIFDPAPYHGDREADIAMTELFGGFDRSFYDAYNAAWPLHKGYGTRKKLYNLYHVLNHFNLFGAGYAAQARIMIDDLLASRPV